MEAYPAVREVEARPLLQEEDCDACPPSSDRGRASSVERLAVERVPWRILPMALLSALAMASTSATAYFAYAALLCKNARHCEGREADKYSTFVAASTAVANILGLSSLGYLQRLAITNRKRGLLFWILCRSMSAVMLLLGVSANNVYLALSGHVFEGLASDNLLHFTLNALYSQSASRDTVSTLIGYSLALYMTGMSISPFVAGLFGNFAISFLLALGLFALSACYLQFCFRSSDFQVATTSSEQSELRGARSERGPSPSAPFRVIRGAFHAIISPLEPFYEDPCHLLIGLSLLVYNVVLSYAFNALLIHSTVRFGFTGTENGYIISITHSVAGLYLFALLFIPHHVKRLFEKRDCVQTVNTVFSHQRKDQILGLSSLGIQTFALATLSQASQAKDIYITTILLAAGLPAPSFIKGYFVRNFETQRGPAALGALATMETLGSVLGPLLLGGLQSHYGVSGGVFLIASGMTATSLLMFALGSVLKT